VSAPLVEALADVPDLVALAAAQPQQFPFLLDSAAHGPLGRYSLLLAFNGRALVQDADGSLHGPGQGSGFLPRLAQWYAQDKYPAQAAGAAPAVALPFVGGWFLYLGYELAAEIEPVLKLPAPAGRFPRAIAARCDAAVVVAHGEPEQAWLMGEDATALERLKMALRAQPAQAATVLREAMPPLARLNAEPGERFKQAVARIHDYLLGGDIFQVNISRGWQGEFAAPVAAASVYRRLRAANPAPFAGLVQWQRQALLSSSPERLVELQGQRAQTRPIAGTHPRSEDLATDLALQRQMLANPKERAEHIMLIDLERNDLGRVCEPGSVEVNELMVAETYTHVHHIVSNVRGTLRAGVDPTELIAAVFPGGTITGCPKVRCMQIIAELEVAGRGFYTGAMGYLDRAGNMDLNILIRSMLLDGQQLAFRTGAGIVADSDPERELEETLHKARGMLAALGVNT
jgi:anthranilate synthase component 1